MTDLRKAAEMALEALETCVCAMQDYQAGIGITEMFDKGERMGRNQIKALRQALAQEGVCCVCGDPNALGIVHSADAPCFHYTKREWVGLTLGEMHQLNDALNLQGRFPIIETIEAKLKEKNA